MSNGFLSKELSAKTSVFGLKLWVLIGIGVVALIFIILVALSIWLSYKRKSKSLLDNIPITQIPTVSKEIKEVKIENPRINGVHNSDQSGDKSSEKALRKSVDGDKNSQLSSTFHSDEDAHSGALTVHRMSAFTMNITSPLVGLPEAAHLGWGHWFTLRDLEIATSFFAKGNVLGEGGYGIVYKGKLPNGTMIAVKNVLNNLGQAEKEFRVEVEAIGHLRTLRGHKVRIGTLSWNGHILTSGGQDGMILNHDVHIRNSLVQSYKGHEQEVCGLKWSPNGQHLASKGNDNLLYIWDNISSTEYQHHMDDHKAAVKALALCPFQSNLTSLWRW